MPARACLASPGSRRYNETMTRTELERLLSTIRGTRIGIVGDFCLDAYWHLDSVALGALDRDGPRHPRGARPALLPGRGGQRGREPRRPRGRQRCAPSACSGTTRSAGRCCASSPAMGVDAAGMLVQPTGWNTPVYVKPVEDGREQNRIDFGNANALDPAVGRTPAGDARARRCRRSTWSIVNQQLVHGIHTEAFRARSLAALVARSGGRGRGAVPFLADSRAFSDELRRARCARSTTAKPCACAGESGIGRRAGPARGRRARRRRARRAVGHRAVPDPGTARHPGARQATASSVVPGLQILGRIDTVGAGDSALAGIAAALAAGSGAPEAAELGNFAAGVTVQKLFTTGTASPAEVLAIGSDPDYVFAPELAADPRRARFHGGTEIEVVTAAAGGSAHDPRDLRQRRHHLHAPRGMGADHGAHDDPRRPRAERWKTAERAAATARCRSGCATTSTRPRASRRSCR